MEHNDKHIDKNLVLMLNLLAEWNIMINTLTRIELKIKAKQQPGI